MGNAPVQEGLLERLFVTPADLARYPAPKQVEAPPHQLAVLGETKEGRVLHATPGTVQHWTDMRRAAQQDGIQLAGAFGLPIHRLSAPADRAKTRSR